MLKVSLLRKIQTKRVTKDELLALFDEVGPLQAIVMSSHASMAWFVSQVMRDQQGKPLRLEPFQMVMIEMLWKKKFPMILGSRGIGKTFLLAVYCILRAILVPGSRIVICGAGFRQAKLVFKFIDTLYKSSPIIQEAANDRPKYGSDQATFELGLSTISAIPIGDGEKVRGMRATVLICDEFASINEDIYEVVLAPFTAVHANPAQRAATMRFIRRIEKLGADKRITEAIIATMDFGNQIVIAGTASHQDNHFYKNYCIYKMFLETRGDTKKIKRAIEERAVAATGKVKVVEHEDIVRMSRTWSHYAIYQLPYHGVPEGFMDEDVIRSSKATFSESRFMREYLAQFPKDTDGFIRRSWIESATPRIKKDQIPVTIELYGDPRFDYVLGLDPARHNDNFGAVVLKITPRGRELVYVSAWNRTDHQKSAARIREIMKRFNIQYIAMDKGGGGDDTLDWLHHKTDGVAESEYLWPIKEQLENLSDLSAPGRKIVELVNFVSATSDMAHGLEAAINRQQLLFPHSGDDIAVRNQYSKHFSRDRLSEAEITKINDDLWGEDTEDIKDKDEINIGVLEEINETTNETCAIIRDTTPGGTERFVLPNLSEQPEGLDMRRRDRFSALMLANYAAKVFSGHGHVPTHRPGMAAGQIRKGPRLSARRSRGRGSVRY